MHSAKPSGTPTSAPVSTSLHNTIDATCIFNPLFCDAGRDRGGIDSCKGDSGGPLFLEIAGQGVVIGVTSWGAGCGNAYAPGVYTRVSMYREWIYQYGTTHA